ncbi:MAG: hypothetical protein J5I94_24385 [Phaeodactylibacter sp.]|nr:hypothetical protein [Phaeodactylibacter sp.]
MILKFKTSGKSALLGLLMVIAAPLSAQEPDTTSLGYKIGYHIGSWLPFGIIVLLVVLILARKSRRSPNE